MHVHVSTTVFLLHCEFEFNLLSNSSSSFRSRLFVSGSSSTGVHHDHDVTLRFILIIHIATFFFNAIMHMIGFRSGFGFNIFDIMMHMCITSLMDFESIVAT